MPSRSKYGLFLCITAIALIFAQVEYGHGAYFIEYIYDNAGNLVERRMTLDNTGPTGTVTINSGAAYTNAVGVVLTLTCSDNVSGCSKMQFSNDNIYYSVLEPYVPSKAWALTDGDGTKTVYAKFQDGVGNWSAVYTDTIVLDTQVPTGTISINAGAAYTNSVNVTLNLTCSGGLSGCSQMQFSNDGTTYSSPEAYSTTKAWTLTTGDGTKTVYSRFKDGAGNWSTAYSDTIILETQMPAGTIIVNRGATYTNSINVTLSLTCSDNLSGCSQMRFSNDNITYSTPEAYAATKAWTLTTGSGAKSVYVKFKDGAGNWSNPFSDTIILNSSCSNSTVRIGTTSYTTLQSAYNAASNGKVIKVQGVMLTENLTVNRNVTVTLEGGYDCGFTTNYGNVTAIKGAITTTVGGGTLTIKNFILSP
jgi:hypothetical protein